MKTFFQIFTVAGSVGIVVLFLLLVANNPRRVEEQTEIASMQKSLTDTAIQLQKIEQDCWDIQRDLYYVVVKAWVLDSVVNHSNFEFSHPVENIDLSPVNNWNALFDAWKPWLQSKTKIKIASTTT